MIVYVETNFVCELGLARQEQRYCADLLRWCEEGRIDLRLPAFSIPEVRRAVRKRDEARLIAITALKKQRDDAKRHPAANSDTYALAEAALRAATEREAEQINSLIVGLYRQVKILPLDAEALSNVEVFRAVNLLRGDGDVFIFASVMRDLTLRRSTGDTAPSLFITGDTDFRNTTHFLSVFSCDLLTSYSAAVARLKGLVP